MNLCSLSLNMNYNLAKQNILGQVFISFGYLKNKTHNSLWSINSHLLHICEFSCGTFHMEAPWSQKNSIVVKTLALHVADLNSNPEPYNVSQLKKMIFSTEPGVSKSASQTKPPRKKNYYLNNAVFKNFTSLTLVIQIIICLGNFLFEFIFDWNLLNFLYIVVLLTFGKLLVFDSQFLINLTQFIVPWIFILFLWKSFSNFLFFRLSV